MTFSDGNTATHLVPDVHAEPAEITVNQVFRNRTDKYGDRTALEKKTRTGWERASWREYYDRACQVGLALQALGIGKADRVCLLSDNRLEWLYTDMGVLGIGACLVPIYSTLNHEEVEFILGNSGSKAIVVENETQLDKALAAFGHCPELKTIVVVEPAPRFSGDPRVTTFADLLDLGQARRSEAPDLFERLAESVQPDDLATIVYTSGTTGIPKGAMITHKNIMAVVKSLDQVRPRYGFETDQTVPFLPLSHVFERIAGHFYGMFVGLTASYAESIDTIIQDIQEKKPTVILAVPRVCEKVYQRILMQVKETPPWKQKVFFWGQRIGAEISRLNEEKKPVPAFLQMEYKFAYALVFKKLKEALGGRVRWITASGAPTGKDIIRFFNAAGITVIEGYGMTECTAPATMSNLADHRIGTVGRPIPGVDIKLAPDGELLVKGDNVFKGYWNMEEETREAFTEDGYLRTGDIGRIYEDGFIEIVDRKKDLIITAGGKNVAPQKIEGLFKKDPLFTQVIVVGDRRKYLSALVNIDLDQAARIARERSIAFASPEELLDREAFLAVVDEHVAALNANLARYETIKRYEIIRHEFSKETGELTATLKVKRRVVQDMYSDLIDAMYNR